VKRVDSVGGAVPVSSSAAGGSTAASVGMATVAAGAECIVVAQMHGRGTGLSDDARIARGGRMKRRAQRGDRLVGAARFEQLTHERREHDEPHGDEAKPCGQVIARASSHDGRRKDGRDSSITGRSFHS
jgi:hypothetical protein